jgi:hypothetical protein
MVKIGKLGMVAMMLGGALAGAVAVAACGGTGSAHAGSGGDGGSGSGLCDCPAPVVKTVQCEQTSLGLAAIATFDGKTEQDLARLTAIARYKDPSKQFGSAEGFTATHVLPTVGAGKAVVYCQDLPLLPLDSVTFVLP